MNWNYNTESLLIANYEYMTDSHLATLLRCSKSAVAKRAKEMGLTHINWTARRDRNLWNNMFDDISWEELSKRIGMPEKSIRHRMDELGWNRG